MADTPPSGCAMRCNVSVVRCSAVHAEKSASVSGDLTRRLCDYQTQVGTKAGRAVTTYQVLGLGTGQKLQKWFKV